MTPLPDRPADATGASSEPSREAYDVTTRGERRRADRRTSKVRIAAVGDFHASEQNVGAHRALFAGVNGEADVLLLAGDLTRRGTPGEMRAAVAELADVEIPIVAVLGNHDFEADAIGEARAILRDRSVHLLDGDAFVLNEHAGIAGAKGYMGGFGRYTLTAFGEPQTKTFVAASIDEVQKLELGLQNLTTPIRVALLHYAPIEGTVIGEPEHIFPFLGTDRLAEPLDRYGVTVAFHGHAHGGAFRGETAGGIPVFNVSLPVLRREAKGDLYYIHEIPIPADADPAHSSAASRNLINAASSG